MIEIFEKLIPSGTKRRPGLPISGVKFIVAHDTGNDNSTAMGNVDYFISSANEMEASAHYFVDDIRIIRCIPEEEKAYHVRRASDIDNSLFGLDSIDYALSVELCYGPKWGPDRNMTSYNNYTDLMAHLCTKYGLDPAKHIVAHATLDPSRRTDPHNAFGKIGVTWDDFIFDVQMKTGKLVYNPETKAVEPAPEIEVIDDTEEELPPNGTGHAPVLGDNTESDVPYVPVTTIPPIDNSIKKLDYITKNTKTYAGLIMAVLGVVGIGDVFTSGELANTINSVVTALGLVLAAIGRVAVALRSK